MYRSNLIGRLREFGFRNLFLSVDTFAGILTFFLLYIYTGGNLAETIGVGIISDIAVVSSTLFAIVLTGFTIITSFTDRYFLLAWKEVGEFGGIVTLFQYNLILPVIVLIASMALLIHYNGLAMILLLSFFIYMLFSLLDLVGFISRYALQRAEFVTQLMENPNWPSDDGSETQTPRLPTERLEEINDLLSEVEDEKN